MSVYVEYFEEFPETRITRAWDANEYIERLVFAGGYWCLFLTRCSTYTTQRWLTNAQFPADAIAQAWDDGLDITSISYGNGVWCVCLSANTGFETQEWISSGKFPSSDIAKAEKKGLYVTHLAYGDNRWIAVVAKKSTAEQQMSDVFRSFPVKTIAKYWSRGYYISAIQTSISKWGLVMNTGMPLTNQYYIYRADFPEGEISEKVDEGFVVVDVQYLEGMWFVLLNLRHSMPVSTPQAGQVVAALQTKQSSVAVELFAQGFESLQNKNFDAAIDSFEHYMHEHGEYADTFYCMGLAWLGKGMHLKALEYFRKAYAMNVASPEIFETYMLQLHAQGLESEMFTEALKCSAKTYKQVASVECLVHVARVLHAHGKAKEALQFAKVAHKKAPTQLDVVSLMQDLQALQRTTPDEVQTKPSTQKDIHSIMHELNNLIGLTQIKTDIQSVMKYIRVEKLRKERGVSNNPLSLHAVFLGAPGTGKTTVARLLGEIYKEMGLLAKGHVVETDRSGLVAEYVGQTAIKTNAVIDSALDGVLFIDEAYSLVSGGNDFGKEAVETLLKRMEDNRERLVVIVAGYADLMNAFLASNPGLQSRFARVFTFADYTAPELLNIYEHIAHSAHMNIEPDALQLLHKYFEYAYNSKTKSFGNARFVRNVYEEILQMQSARLADLEHIADDDLLRITLQDVKHALHDKYVEDVPESIDDIMQELNAMIGLHQIKQDIQTLLTFIKVEKLKKENGLASQKIALHSICMGSPGTGKTTVARYLGRIYKALGILPKGHVVEVSRTDLVASYVGQTAPKTNAVIDSALHGVLFIDEAYSLASKGNSGDFGAEAIETILKRMEDDRDKFVVVFAGYTHEMKMLIESNPGLQSRFTRYFSFADYSPQELMQIFLLLCSQHQLCPSADAQGKLQVFFEQAWQCRNEHFGNGRFVRNVYEACVQQQSSRLASFDSISKLDLLTIHSSDVEPVITSYAGSFLAKSKPMGFR